MRRLKFFKRSMVNPVHQQFAKRFNYKTKNLFHEEMTAAAKLALCDRAIEEMCAFQLNLTREIEQLNPILKRMLEKKRASLARANLQLKELRGDRENLNDALTQEADSDTMFEEECVRSLEVSF